MPRRRCAPLLVLLLTLMSVLPVATAGARPHIGGGARIGLSSAWRASASPTARQGIGRPWGPVSSRGRIALAQPWGPAASPGRIGLGRAWGPLAQPAGSLPTPVL